MGILSCARVAAKERLQVTVWFVTQSLTVARLLFGELLLYRWLLELV